MLILNTVDKSLEVFLGATPSSELPWTASYVDITTTTFGPIADSGTTNGITPVTLIGHPTGSTQRQTKFLSLSNQSTGQQTVTIQVNDGGTLRVVFKCALDVGDTLFYIDSHGFTVLNSAGSVKTGTSSGTLTEDGHKVLRQLIHFLPDGPGDGFSSAPYRDISPPGAVFPTSVTWWLSDAKLIKLLEKTISYNVNKSISSIVWKIYDSSGSLVIQATDTISYSGIFETSRTRTFA